jgi:hypothetical protein
MRPITRTKNRLAKDYGIKAIKIELPRKESDGAIVLSESVHIQYPTVGNSLNVVRQIDAGTFYFYPCRTKWAELVSDVREALAAT